MSTLIHYKNNLSPSLSDTIRVQGVAFDLTGSSVKLQARGEAATTLLIDAAATIVTASSTLSSTISLPTREITVASATGFLAAGSLAIGPDNQVVDYEEISGDTFMGCTGGEGTISAGATVAQRGGVRYDWVSGDVDEAIELEAWWRVTLPSSKVQDTPPFAVHIIDPLAVERGLCELADVISYAPGYAQRQDLATNALLQRMIMAKTREIQRETHQEFIAYTTGSGTRRFALSDWNVDERKVVVGSLISPSAVRIIDGDQTTVLETVASTDYVTYPYVRESWQPIEVLEFPSGTALPAGLGTGYILEVVGTWGYVTVPEDIREACACLVLVEYVTNPALVGTALTQALGEVNAGALFAMARRVVDGYRPTLVAWY